LDIGNENWFEGGCVAGLDIGKDGSVGGIIIDGVLLSPVSLRLFMRSRAVSSDRSRLRMGFRFGCPGPVPETTAVARPMCCRRAISFSNIDGRSAYNCWMRSVEAKSTGVGGSIMGRTMLL